MWRSILSCGDNAHWFPGCADQQPRPRAEHCWALFGAQPHLLLRKCRRAGSVFGQRRLDAAKLYERVEVLYPIKDEDLRERICKEILPAYLADNKKARVLGSDGHYSYVARPKGNQGFSVPEHLMKLATGFVNGSGKPQEHRPQIAYTKVEPGNVPSESAQTLKLEVQDSSNATV